MKIKFFSFVALLLAAGIFPASGNGQNPKVNTTITGKVNLNDQFEAVLTFREKDKGAGKNITVPISESGKFSFQFYLNKPEFVNLIIIPKSRNRQLAINFPLFVTPGSKAYPVLNYNDTSYLSILRDSKIESHNQALILYSNFHSLKQKELFFSPPATDSIKLFLAKYSDTAEGLISRFKIKNQKIINYLRVWAMNDFFQALETIETKYARTHNEKLPPQYYSFSKSPATIYNNDEAILLNGTLNSLRKYITLIDTSGKNKYPESLQTISQRLNLFNGIFSNRKLKTVFNSGELEAYVKGAKFSNEHDYDEALSKFKNLTKEIPDSNLQNALVKDFTNIKFTREGAAIPDVIFKDANGREVSLRSFKGKNIYIDLWASWCIPCIAEIPNLRKLEQEYKGKNIVFISISLDEDKKAWIHKMKELNLSGIQLENGDSGFEKMMNIQGIPHFILYGADGKLKMYKAPRPGSTSIRQIFDSL